MKSYLLKKLISMTIACTICITPLSIRTFAIDSENIEDSSIADYVNETSQVEAVIEETPINQEAQDYMDLVQNYSDKVQIKEVEQLGAMPSPISIPGTNLSIQSALPSKFSSRDNGWTTPVKNQADHGLCVMFSCMASLETQLLKNNMGLYDFSERHMSWAMTPDATGYGWQRVINDYSGKYEGTYGFAAAGFLASNLGPKLESDIPYIPTLNDYKPDNMNTAPTQIDVTDIIYINVDDVNNIKTAISKYGAVSTSYDSYPQYYSDSQQAYYMPDKSSKLGLHEISVVGWDDNYSKYNFGTYKPYNDGAWLIKNSWGPNMCDNGYLWISYEDAMLFKCNDICPAYAIGATRKQGNIKLYQHDEFGAINIFKIRSKNESVPLFYNVYNFTADYHTLDSVKFFSSSIGASYNIYYAPVNSNGVPVTDKSAMTKLASGRIDHSGYTSVPTSDYNLPIGIGSIALEISSLDNNILLGVDTDYSPNSFCGFKSKIGEKTCYISIENSIDEFRNTAHKTAEISLKAVTKKDTTPPDPSKTGWINNPDGSWSYKRNNTLLTGWINDIYAWEGTWFYFDMSGIMKTGWFKVGETWYYSAQNGVMQTGWVNDNGTWYFMSPNGDMKTGWIIDTNKWYYLAPNGAMQTGWVFYSGKWYYLSPNHGGALLGGGWLYEGGNWYYLADDGSMLTGSFISGDKIYYFADNGVWLGTSSI